MEVSTQQKVTPSNPTITIPELGLAIIHFRPAPDTVEGVHKIKVINTSTEDDFTGKIYLDSDDNLTFGDSIVTPDELDVCVAAGESQDKNFELKIERYGDTPDLSTGTVTLIFKLGDHVESTTMQVN